MTPRAPEEGLGRHERLRRRPDYVSVQEKGRRLPGRHYLLLYLPRGTHDASAAARLGITVSKKVGTAVERNRVKRWVRESYRRAKTLTPLGIDLVLIARPSAAQAGFSATDEELRMLLRRLRVR